MDYENRSPAVEGVQKSWGRPVWEWSWSCKTDRGNRVWVLRVFLVFQGWKSVVGVWELRVAPPQWSRDWVGRGSRLLTSKDGQFVRHWLKKGSSHWLRIQCHVILYKYKWSTISSDYRRPLWLYSVLSEYGTVNAFGQRQSRGLSSAAITPFFKMSQSAPIPILTLFPSLVFASCIILPLQKVPSVLFVGAIFWITIALPSLAELKTCTISSSVIFASCHHTTLPKTQQTQEWSAFAQLKAGNWHLYQPESHHLSPNNT